MTAAPQWQTLTNGDHRGGSSVTMTTNGEKEASWLLYAGVTWRRSGNDDSDQ